MKKEKKAQISMEVMYSVGVMLVIFVILIGISFNRRVEIQDREDFIIKRDECYQFADYISAVATGGNGTYAEVYTRHDIEILDVGVIVVGKDENQDSVTATCTAVASISTMKLSTLTEYRIQNINDRVNITKIG